MAVIDNFATPRFTVPAIVRSLVTSVLDNRKRRADYLDTIRELSVMSDRELHDVGIARSEIPNIARRVANGTSVAV